MTVHMPPQAAQLCFKAQPMVKATVALSWDPQSPLTVTITVTGDEPVTWDVSRNLFIHAAQPWARGSWIGSGDFRLCYAGNQAMFGFHGGLGGQRVTAVVLTAADPVTAFIDDTYALIPPSSDLEADTITGAVDDALARILGADRG